MTARIFLWEKKSNSNKMIRFLEIITKVHINVYAHKEHWYFNHEK